MRRVETCSYECEESELRDFCLDHLLPCWIRKNFSYLSVLCPSQLPYQTKMQKLCRKALFLCKIKLRIRIKSKMNVYQTINNDLFPWSKSADCTLLGQPPKFKPQVLAVALFWGLSTASNAQQSAEKLTKLKEMVITVTKREDPLQEVSISVTAIEGEILNQLDFRNSGDIAAQTPNLQWRSNFGNSLPTIFLRSIGNSSFHSNVIGPVAVYLVSSYRCSNVVQGFTLFDPKRVKVLRGGDTGYAIWSQDTRRFSQLHFLETKWL